MGDFAQAGQVLCTGASGTIAVTGMSFKPNLVFFTSTGRKDGTDVLSANPGGSGNYAESMFGVAILQGGVISQWVTNHWYEDGGPPAPGHGVLADATQCVFNKGGRKLSLTSFDSGGFTLTINAGGADINVHYLALQLPAGFNQAVGTFSGLNGAGPQDVTGVTAFLPKAVVFSSVAGLTSNDSNNMIGAATGPSSRWVFDTDHWGASTGSGIQVRGQSYQDNQRCIAVGGGGGDAGDPAARDTADFVTFLDAGWRLNWMLHTGSDTPVIYYWATDYPGLALGSFAVPNPNGTVSAKPGFRPDAMMLFHREKTAYSASDVFSGGASHDLTIGLAVDTTNRFVVAPRCDIGNTEGANSMDTRHTQQSALVYDRIGGPAMDLQSVDVDGMTFVITVNETQATLVNYIAFSMALHTGPAAARSVGDPSAWVRRV